MILSWILTCLIVLVIAYFATLILGTLFCLAVWIWVLGPELNSYSSDVGNYD
jgi:hypothetical protein